MKIKTYEDGSARLLWDWRDIALTTANFETLRAFFQAERDEALGRWRDPDNPDMVCYQVKPDTPRTANTTDWILVVDERDASSAHYCQDWIQPQRKHLDAETDFPASADRYFEAHPEPEPKPWEEAKAGEIWAIDLLEDGPSACLVSKGDFIEITGLFEVAIDSSLIESARRIWPEEDK